MSLAAIKQITEIEQSLQQQLEQAKQAAKETVANAEAAGQALLERRRAEAETACSDCLAEAEQQAAEEAHSFKEQTDRQCAALKQGAVGRLKQAADLIVGRVVNG